MTETSGVVIAPASIAVAGGAKSIQHAEGGLVSEILAHNGDVATQVVVLIRLDGTSTRASLAVVEAQLEDALARRSRLYAETGVTAGMEVPVNPLRPPGADFAGLFAAGQRLLQTSADTVQGTQTRLDEQIQQLEQQATGLRT